MPIKVHPGVNHVRAILPYGATATIIQAWRGNGPAHGYHLGMVLTGASEGKAVGLAAVEQSGDVHNETIRDDPFDAERALGDVRFARAQVDGRTASVVIAAYVKGTQGVLADHRKATVTVNRLEATEVGIGAPLSFARVAMLPSTKRYCNVDLALRNILGVALGDDYAGPSRIDGWF